MKFSKKGVKVLYVSGEESEGQNSNAGPQARFVGQGPAYHDGNRFVGYFTAGAWTAAFPSGH
jgi:hypothetical protein